jgi:histidinol-phosphate phosphatase family protein
MKVPSYVVVVPTIGRPCLQECLDALAKAVSASDCAPRQVVLVDDRRDTPEPLSAVVPGELADLVIEVTLEGRGPAAARNAGWHAADPSEWVVFLDDDVRVTPEWAEQLAADLAEAAPGVGGVQGVIEVPWPRDRRPADSQRATLGLAGAPWITADMAYRRAALADAGGFDERFPRAYREDSDLALRVSGLGWSLRRGRRRTEHPVRPASLWASIRAQAGNADDALIRRRHGPDWRRRAGAAAGRRAAHLTTCALGAGAAAFAAAAAGRGGTAAAARGGTAARRAATACAAGWLGLTAEFATRRIAAGPRTWPETGAMLATSAVIPPLAAWHWLAGTWRARSAGPWPPLPAAVLFDRDGTLVHDVPYNTDPALVVPVPGAAQALDALRRAGIGVGVVSNQSGVGQGIITPDQLSAVNARVEELLGPFGTWRVCTHRADAGCACRKPSPGLVSAAANDLGVTAARCVVIGDIAADVAAARAAGARGILVPAARTSAGDLVGLPRAESLGDAVAAILAGRALPSWRSAGKETAGKETG